MTRVIALVLAHSTMFTLAALLFFAAGVLWAVL
jgi:hypothetical protein